MVTLLDQSTPFQFTVSFRNNSGALVDVTTPTVEIYDYTNQRVFSTTSDFTTVSTGIKNFLLNPASLTTQGTYRAIFYGDYSSQRLFSDSPELFEVTTLGEFITYASTKEVIDYLELEEPVSIILLRNITQAVTRVIDAYCRQQFRQYTVTEEEHWINAENPDSELFLQKYPVIAISSITQDDTALSSDDYDIDLHIGRLGFAAATSGIFKVTYTAGVTSVPDPVNLAAIKYAAYLYQRRKREGIASEALLGYSYSLWNNDDDPVIKDIKTLLQPYIHVRIL